MIRKEDCILLGTLTRTHGIKGSLLLWLSQHKADDINFKESVFVEIDGLLVPFFIESFHQHSAEKVILSFEGIHSDEKAKVFAGALVYSAPGKLKKKRKTATELSHLTGYRITDTQRGFVGIAGEILDIANNPLLQVISEGKAYLIPLHADIILEINKKKKAITISAPDGLFDL